MDGGTAFMIFCFGVLAGLALCALIAYAIDKEADKKYSAPVTVEIKVPARWNGGEGVAVFRRGLGPCGKTVTDLGGYWSDDRFIIFQRCGTEKKEFTYLREQISGRIVITSDKGLTTEV